MDFESCLTDCCMACNSLCPNFKTSSKIRGQGDCKDSINFQEHQIDWEKGKNIRNKYREESRFGFKEEQPKKQLNTHCNCFCKNNENQDFFDQIRHEAQYEKSNDEIFQNCDPSWNSPYGSWTRNSTKESNVFNDLRNNEHSNSDKSVDENIAELKEKVDFLLKNFKEHKPKIFNDSCNKQQHGDNYGALSRDVSNLFNINKRLSIVERHIQTLTLILEDLLKDSIRRKASFSNKNPIFSEPSNFEEMPVSQKINVLKSRIDFLVSFIRNFLQVRSVEEMNSALDLMPRDCESNENPWNSAFCFVGGEQSDNLNQKNVIKAVDGMRVKVGEENKETSQTSHDDYSARYEKRRENATKYYKNKLEVISEQAELAFYYDNEREDPDEYEKKSNGLLKEKITEVKQKAAEKNSDKTARLLAQEAMLKLSLDKANLEMISKPDSCEKNYFLRQSHPLTLPNETTTEENKDEDTEISLDSSRSTYWEIGKNDSKLSSRRKYRVQEEYKKEIKPEPVSSSSQKKSSLSNRKTNKISDSKNRSCKVLKQKSHTLMTPVVIPKQNSCCWQDMCSFSREESKKEVGTKNQRPLSTPGSHNKTLRTSDVKAIVTEKNTKINNVKNKNKLLLSQKSCVRTA